MKTCATCQFARRMSANLADEKRLCHGLPPVPNLYMEPNGSARLSHPRPVVMMDDPACSLHKPLDITGGNAHLID